MGLKIGGPVSLHTSLCIHINPVAPVADDDGWQCTDIREKETQTYKDVLLGIADCSCWSMRGDLLKKYWKDGIEKGLQSYKKNPQIKGERWDWERKRNEETCSFKVTFKCI